MRMEAIETDAYKIPDTILNLEFYNNKKLQKKVEEYFLNNGEMSEEFYFTKLHNLIHFEEAASMKRTAVNDMENVKIGQVSQTNRTFRIENTVRIS